MSDFKVAGKMSLDGANFFSTMKAAEGATRKLAGLFAGAFSIGAVTAFSKSVLDLAGKLKDVSSALSINVEFLQKFLNSAATSGGSLEGIEKFIAESNKSRQEALNNPSGKESGAFGRLGFSSQDISSLNAQQFIEKIIKSFSGGITPQLLNDVKEIGGKSALSLANGFASGIDENTSIMTSGVIDELDEVGDKLTTLSSALRSEFAPALVFVSEKAKELFEWAQRKMAGVATAVNGGGVEEDFKTRAQMEQQRIAIETSSARLVMEGKKTEAEHQKTMEILRGAENTQMLQETASEAEEAVAKVQKEADELAKKARLAKAAAQEAANAESPNFVRQSEGNGKTKSRSITSDSLTSVGNFLGAGKTGSLENIGQRQLTVQQSIAEWVRKSYELANKGGTAIPTL